LPIRFDGDGKKKDSRPNTEKIQNYASILPVTARLGKRNNNLKITKSWCGGTRIAQSIRVYYNFELAFSYINQNNPVS
jgi:hypothetical protein